MRERIGVIGLGNMGVPMARRLLEGGLEVHVWARRPDASAALAELGAIEHPTPASLAASVGAILFILPDVPEIEAVLDGPDGVLAGAADELLLIVGSTSSPAAVRALAERMQREARARVRVVDAPVSGGVEGAAAGSLAIMIGGDDDAAAQTAELLRPCGTAVHLGPLGSGQVAKACNQMIVAATIMALGEASALAVRCGLDLEAMLALLRTGYADSRMLETRAARLVAQDYSVAGAAKYLVKDLGFALAEAERTGTVLRSTETLLGSFKDLVARGFGGDDLSVTRAYVEGLS